MSRSMRKLDHLLRTLIAEEIAQLKDPRVGFVTITSVETTPDLERADVYYTVLGDAAETERGLRSASPRVRKRVAERLSLRRMPELEFRPDHSSQAAQRVSEILSKLRQRDD